MKKILKNKKIMIPIIVIIVILIILGSYFFIFSNNGSIESRVKKEGTFVAYIKINPLVKFTFNSTYYECTENNKTKICGKYTSAIESAELLNDDAEEVYKNIDFKGKSLDEGISMLIATAYENEINVESVSVYTDWSYKLNNIKNKVKNNLNSEIDVNITFTYKKNLDEKEIIENNTDKTYTITFDTDGGSSIENQEVKENETITKPSDPSKDGYTFAGWTLDGNGFDFSTNITSGLTLKANWSKNESSSSNETTSSSSSASSSSSTSSTQSTTSSSNESTSSTSTTLGANEYYAIKDGQVHKYTFTYSDESTCLNNAEGDAYGKVSYSFFGCDEIKDANGNIKYGLYFMSSTSASSIFYY